MSLAGSSLEQQPLEVLDSLLGTLWDDGHSEAVAMVVDAMLVREPNDTSLISLCGHLEAIFDAVKALQSFSKCFELGGGDAWDNVMYGQLLLQTDKQAAANALSHAVAICEPSERFDVLVKSALGKAAIRDGQEPSTTFQKLTALVSSPFTASNCLVSCAVHVEM